MIPRWRKATWALVLWSLLIVIWAVAGAAGNDCGSQTTTLDKNACQAGTGIGVALILLIGFFGFVFLSFIWLMSRPRRRQCPRCGESVKKGLVQCPSCSYDFGAIGTPVPAGVTAPPADVP